MPLASDYTPQSLLAHWPFERHGLSAQEEFAGWGAINYNEPGINRPSGTFPSVTATACVRW